VNGIKRKDNKYGCLLLDDEYFIVCALSSHSNKEKRRRIYFFRTCGKFCRTSYACILRFINRHRRALLRKVLYGVFLFPSVPVSEVLVDWTVNGSKNRDPTKNSRCAAIILYCSDKLYQSGNQQRLKKSGELTK